MHTNTIALSNNEKRATLSLVLILAFRMLGLFMIFPIFSAYAHNELNASSTLIGIALGIYGLTQACFQIPFGMLSDKLGRKPIIAFGLILFALGSLIAGYSDTIYGIILGRALQGTGAIGSTVIAFIADLTQEEKRTKAMAIMGMGIGLSFTLAMLLGPLLNEWIGVSGIFFFTFFMALIGILILFSCVPTPQIMHFHYDNEPSPKLFKRVLKNKELLRLDAGIFILHALLTATFIAIPIALIQFMQLSSKQQTWLYLAIMILACIFMVPLVILAEKKQQIKKIFLLAIIILAISQMLFYFCFQSPVVLILGLFIFFTAFITLESLLPSLISKISPLEAKGTAIGIYSTSQFLGAFAGGSIGGYWFQHHSFSIFLLSGGLALLWLILASSMQKPMQWGTYLVKLKNFTENEQISLKNQLVSIVGVKSVFISNEEKIAYLKIDPKLFDSSSVDGYRSNEK